MSAPIESGSVAAVVAVPVRQQVLKYLAEQFPRSTVLDRAFGADHLVAIFAEHAARVGAEAVAEADKAVEELATELAEERTLVQAHMAEAVATEQQRIVEQIGDMCTYRERDGRALPHPHPSDHLGPCPYGQVVWHILAEQRAEAESAALPVDLQSLAEVGDRVPVMAVLTVGGRWVACTVTDAGVTGGFRTWQGVPADADLRRSEVHSIWSDVPPWSPAIGLIRFPDELAAGQWAECRHCGAWSPPGEDHSCSCPNPDDECPIHPPGTVG